jgi:hypothetical protein
MQLAKEQFCANISSEKFNATTLRSAIGGDLIRQRLNNRQIG